MEVWDMVFQEVEVSVEVTRARSHNVPEILSVPEPNPLSEARIISSTSALYLRRPLRLLLVGESTTDMVELLIGKLMETLGVVDEE